MKKYVKYLYSFICFLFLFLIWFCFGYEQQWFSHYYEWEDWISFNCIEECTIKIWQKNEIDYLYLSWILNWSGTIGYGFYVWNDFSFLNQHKFEKPFNVSKFVDLMRYNRKLHPKTTDLLLLISWDVQWNLYLQSWKLSILQKVNLARKNFWRMEIYDQYALHLRYGVSIRWISIVEYGYILFILISLGILLLKKWKWKYKLIFYIWLTLFLFIWIRNVVTYTYTLKQGLYWFNTDKTYFEFWDYFSFIDKIRNELDLDSRNNNKDCKILIEYNEDFNYWPLEIYLKPCELASTWDFVNYKIYYKKEIPIEDLDKKVLLGFSGSYLLENQPK